MTICGRRLNCSRTLLRWLPIGIGMASDVLWANSSPIRLCLRTNGLLYTSSRLDIGRTSIAEPCGRASTRRKRGIAKSPQPSLQSGPLFGVAFFSAIVGADEETSALEPMLTSRAKCTATVRRFCRRRDAGGDHHSMERGYCLGRKLEVAESVTLGEH